MIFFSEDFFPHQTLQNGQLFVDTLGLNTKEMGQHDFQIFSFSLCSPPSFFFPRQSKQPVIIPDQGITCQISHLFSQFLVVSLMLQRGMLWCPFSGMKDVCGVTFPIHGFCRAHLQILSPVLCKCDRVEHRTSHECSKYRGSSFQTMSFKDKIKPNSPNVVKDLKGSRHSMPCRW